MKTTQDKNKQELANQEQQVLMAYYQEIKQQELDECLKDPDRRYELKQLEADMLAIEQRLSQDQPQLPVDYGQQLWLKVADQIEKSNNKAPSKRSNWLQQFKNLILMPQYSLASVAVFMGLIMVAFYAGKQHNGENLGVDLQEQLLAQNIQLHLTQSEIFLTQVSNDSSNYNTQATAQRLLSSNRIFKQALANHPGQLTHQILQELEPVLLEFANQSSDNDLTGVTPKQTHGQQPQANWVNDSKSNDLLFQIKTMKQQLTQKNDLI